MSQERHFGGDAMVGNRLHNGYVSIREGDFTLTECFEEYPEIRNKFNFLWKNLTKGDQHFSIRDPTPEESENCAKECEEWCKVFPVFFPNRNITRKMIEYSLVLPRFIREKKGLMNKILRLEQEGERLHSEYNNIENSYKCIYNRATRFWLMIENYENKLYATK